jgi:hypothetical protein
MNLELCLHLSPPLCIFDLLPADNNSQTWNNEEKVRREDDRVWRAEEQRALFLSKHWSTN